MAARRKRRGHFCWACARVLPNPRFSGAGHARHVCRECARLPTDELAYRQEVRNIDRMLDWSGRVRRKEKKSFERMLAHPMPRVRAYAEAIVSEAEWEREEHRRLREEDEAAMVAADAWLGDGFDTSELDREAPRELFSAERDLDPARLVWLSGFDGSKP